MLPAFYLWALMACVSICEQKTLATHESDLFGSTGITEIQNAPDCDGCPLSYFPKATTPERARSIFALASLASLLPAIPSLNSAGRDVFSIDLHRPPRDFGSSRDLRSPLRI